MMQYLLGHQPTIMTCPLTSRTSSKKLPWQGISLKGKIGAAFGSYGWSGEAPKLILEIMKYKFEMQVVEPPLLAKYLPDQNVLNACKEPWKKSFRKLDESGLT